MAKEAVGKTLDVRIWLDLTGGGHANEPRMRRVVERIRQAALDAAEEEGLAVQEVGGDWTFYYQQSWDDIAPLKKRATKAQPTG
ncbi:hypothetical protein ACWD8I_09005 [Micromonospora arida]